jgi:hypothetical protein
LQPAGKNISSIPTVQRPYSLTTSNGTLTENVYGSQQSSSNESAIAHVSGNISKSNPTNQTNNTLSGEWSLSESDSETEEEDEPEPPTPAQESKPADPEFCLISKSKFLNKYEKTLTDYKKPENKSPPKAVMLETFIKDNKLAFDVYYNARESDPISSIILGIDLKHKKQEWFLGSTGKAKSDYEYLAKSTTLNPTESSSDANGARSKSKKSQLSKNIPDIFVKMKLIDPKELLKQNISESQFYFVAIQLTDFIKYVNHKTEMPKFYYFTELRAKSQNIIPLVAR